MTSQVFFLFLSCSSWLNKLWTASANISIQEKRLGKIKLPNRAQTKPLNFYFSSLSEFRSVSKSFRLKQKVNLGKTKLGLNVPCDTGWAERSGPPAPTGFSHQSHLTWSQKDLTNRPSKYQKLSSSPRIRILITFSGAETLLLIRAAVKRSRGGVCHSPTLFLTPPPGGMRSASLR